MKGPRTPFTRFCSHAICSGNFTRSVGVNGASISLDPSALVASSEIPFAILIIFVFHLKLPERNWASTVPLGIHADAGAFSKQVSLFIISGTPWWVRDAPYRNALFLRVYGKLSWRRPRSIRLCVFTRAHSTPIRALWSSAAGRRHAHCIELEGRVVSSPRRLAVFLPVFRITPNEMGRR